MQGAPVDDGKEKDWRNVEIVQREVKKIRPVDRLSDAA
jgi:hypothetical protein